VNEIDGGMQSVYDGYKSSSSTLLPLSIMAGCGIIVFSLKKINVVSYLAILGHVGMGVCTPRSTTNVLV